MTGPGPVWADRIRKAAALLLAAGGTFLLLRMLYRLAHGEQEWADPELWLFLALAGLAALWVAKARPVRDAGSSEATGSRRVRPPPGGV